MVKQKAEGLAIPNNVFMQRFATGIAPKGLAESLVSRINDQLLPDFKSLLQVATKEIVDHDGSKIFVKFTLIIPIINYPFLCFVSSRRSARCKEPVEEVHEEEVNPEDIRVNLIDFIDEVPANSAPDLFNYS
ncbi:hypothetical protein P9112_005260 [Eukaryota sp. TZLM1-RC]